MTVEVWARPATPDELAKHPAALFGERATAAGFTVDYRYARGPVTVRRRPDEPDERGKYALVEVTDLVDTIGVRAQHPDGRRIAAWWTGRSFGEGWAASPRSNARQLGIRALTAYLTDTEEDTIVDKMGHEIDERRSGVLNAAKAAYEKTGYTFGNELDAFTEGYMIGQSHAIEDQGDSYGEGYAAGLAAITKRERVWVAARRALGELRPGDVILGKGDRWFIVTLSKADTPRAWIVEAVSNDDREIGRPLTPTTVTVQGDAKRKVDVVVPIATADALAALRDEEMGATPIEDDEL